MKKKPTVQVSLEDVRPESLMFLGRKISVHYVDEEDMKEDALGLFNSRKQSIVIMDGMTPVEELDTFLHEVLHMVIHYMGVMMGQVDEEMVVHRTATGLSGLFAANPHMLAYLAVLQAMLEEEQG